jgi:hypothetical protein
MEECALGHEEQRKVEGNRGDEHARDHLREQVVEHISSVPFDSGVLLVVRENLERRREGVGNSENAKEEQHAAPVGRVHFQCSKFT